MNNINTQLSAKSKKFLEDLRVYLFSSGKNEDETEEVIEELEVHLTEAEENGKPIEKIIGQTPKAYMEQLSNEMAIDYAAWFKYIPIIILGAFSFTIVGDLIQGELSYSLLSIFGHLFITFLFLVLVFWSFKYISVNSLSNSKQALIFFVLGLLPISMFVGLIYLDRAIETPIIHFGIVGTIMTAIITFVFVVGVSIWAKTWVLVILLTLLNLPEYLLGQTTIEETTQLIAGTAISYGGIAIYLLITMKRNKD